MTSVSASRELARLPLKLCVLVPDHWAAIKGGSEYQAQVLVDLLVQRYDVRITYLTLGSDPAFHPNGYRIEIFSSRRGLRRYGKFLDALRLYRALEREAPDVIYQQVGCAHTGIAAYYAKKHGCRMLWRIAHDDDVTRQRPDWARPHRIIERSFLEYGLRNAGTILAQTENQKALLSSNYGRDDAIVVRNFHPLPSSDEHDDAQANGKKRVVWVANLKPSKNPDAFVRLALRFVGNRDVEFVMVGAWQANPAWIADVTALMRSAPNLRYLGEQRQDEVNALLHGAYALVSTSHGEGFSNVFIQAWMRGVPVVSLSVNPDGLLDGEALGFASGSEDRLYDDVAKLIENPALRDAMASKARGFAIAEFSEQNIERIADLMGLVPRHAPV
ncbi:MAG TPA: glycosyltransferase family 4 protein [Candidatus Baltobacteraceae bacterium]|nr:glycosyltransferase family 4 protein [Candidatus Baltobacteraceae bacterium]